MVTHVCGLLDAYLDESELFCLSLTCREARARIAEARAHAPWCRHPGIGSLGCWRWSIRAGFARRSSVDLATHFLEYASFLPVEISPDHIAVASFVHNNEWPRQLSVVGKRACNHGIWNYVFETGDMDTLKKACRAHPLMMRIDIDQFPHALDEADDVVTWSATQPYLGFDQLAVRRQRLDVVRAAIVQFPPCAQNYIEVLLRARDIPTEDVFATASVVRASSPHATDLGIDLLFASRSSLRTIATLRHMGFAYVNAPGALVRSDTAVLLYVLSSAGGFIWQERHRADQVAREIAHVLLRRSSLSSQQRSRLWTANREALRYWETL